MTGPYTPGASTAAENAAAEEAKKALKTAEEIKEILEQVKTINPGLRILCMEAPLEKKAGVIILPDVDGELKKMGCKRFMVLKSSMDIPSAMKNADWGLEAAKSHSVMPMELKVRVLVFGDYVWAAPFAAAKIPVYTAKQVTTVGVLNWGDVIATQKKDEDND